MPLWPPLYFLKQGVTEARVAALRLCAAYSTPVVNWYVSTDERLVDR
jgi:hypothetical protein